MKKEASTYALIMAGGVGSRFWPASREALPKQFLDMMGVGKSLLRLTYERFLDSCPIENIYVLTHEKYFDLVLEHLPELKPHQVITEPTRNNTAPCIAYATFKLRQLDPDAVLVVSPADHVILQPQVFTEVIAEATSYAAQNPCIVTIGITPSRPDTGYGYIRMGTGKTTGKHPIYQVEAFTEKPDHDRAEAYIQSGKYVWNAGLFVFQAAFMQNTFHMLAPEIYRHLSPDVIPYNTRGEADAIKTNYPLTPSISVDYAIMEKCASTYTIPADFGWSDLGTWASLFAERKKSENHNVTDAAPLDLEEVHKCLIRLPQGKLGVIRGLDDFLVIDEQDVLLIYPKGYEQEIKAVTRRLKERGLEGFL